MMYRYQFHKEEAKVFLLISLMKDQLLIIQFQKVTSEYIILAEVECLYDNEGNVA